jgi:glycosyltransferase involved in cell wall biosynthesis
VIISGEMGPRTILASLYRQFNPACRLIIWATVSERTEAARNGRHRRALRRLLIGRVDGVLVNGASGRRYIEKLGMSANRITEMPYSMSLDQYSATPRHDPRSIRRLLIIGQLIERKGIVPWLEAANGWAETEKDQQIEIWLAGHGPLESRIANLPMASNIGLSLLGPVKYEALPNLYAQCGILVFPTLADEWGIVVNEAMAAGLPVMGSIHAQAVEELVKDGVNGWHFDPTSRHSAQDALQRAFATPAAQLDAMRGAARAAIAPITPDAMAEKMKSACDMVIARRDPIAAAQALPSSALDPALDMNPENPG